MTTHVTKSQGRATRINLLKGSFVGAERQIAKLIKLIEGSEELAELEEKSLRRELSNLQDITKEAKKCVKKLSQINQQITQRLR